jgi:hypothetical protein
LRKDFLMQKSGGDDPDQNIYGDKHLTNLSATIQLGTKK